MSSRFGRKLSRFTSAARNTGRDIMEWLLHVSHCNSSCVRSRWLQVTAVNIWSSSKRLIRWLFIIAWFCLFNIWNAQTALLPNAPAMEWGNILAGGIQNGSNPTIEMYLTRHPRAYCENVRNWSSFMTVWYEDGEMAAFDSLNSTGHSRRQIHDAVKTDSRRIPPYSWSARKRPLLFFAQGTAPRTKIRMNNITALINIKVVQGPRATPLQVRWRPIYLKRCKRAAATGYGRQLISKASWRRETQNWRSGRAYSIEVL